MARDGTEFYIINGVFGFYDLVLDCATNGKLIAPITHLSSATTRDNMHQEAKTTTDESLTNTNAYF